MITQQESDELVAGIERELDDLEHDAVWLIQHGRETDSFETVKQGLEALAARRRELQRSLPCAQFRLDPVICDDVGEPKGQCVCGWGEEDHNI